MPPENTVHVAIELSVSSWLVAARLPGIEKPRLRCVKGGDTTALLALIAELRSRAGRTRRIAIVAMARKLLIALWRYVETGTMPEGVEIRAQAEATA